MKVTRQRQHRSYNKHARPKGVTIAEAISGKVGRGHGIGIRALRRALFLRVRDGACAEPEGCKPVDSLTTSAVFDNAARRYVAGDISARQPGDIVDDYYDQKRSGAAHQPLLPGGRPRSTRICDALDSNRFTFSPATLHAPSTAPLRCGTALLRAALPRLQHLEARVRPRAGNQ